MAEKDVSAEKPVGNKYDLTAAYERGAHLMIPRAFFPVFSAFFVILCAGMAVMLFGVGKIFGGTLFSFVVLVGLYVLWNNLCGFRDLRRARRGVASGLAQAPTAVDEDWARLGTRPKLFPGMVVLCIVAVVVALSGIFFGSRGAVISFAVVVVGLIAWRIVSFRRARPIRKV